MFGMAQIEYVLEAINRIGRALERMADAADEMVRLTKQNAGDGK